MTPQALLAPARLTSSLRQKAMLLVLGTTASALILGAAVFLVFEGFASRRADAHGLASLAEKQQDPGWVGIPVIVLTARDLSEQEQERERLRQAQVTAVLQKGLYSKGELMEEVRRAVQRGLDEGFKGGQG